MTKESSVAIIEWSEVVSDFWEALLHSAFDIEFFPMGVSDEQFRRCPHVLIEHFLREKR
jgi:hypothetical protein